MPVEASTLPATGTQLSHSLAIKVGTRLIGVIHEWNPKQTRAIAELYEFGQVTPGQGVGISGAPGEPYEKTPGNVSGMEISVARYDLYSSQFELAFPEASRGGITGALNLTMLSRQDQPFEVVEIWTTPDNPSNGSLVFPNPSTEAAGPGGKYYNVYKGCWFSDVGRTLDAKGDRVVNVSATLHYTRKNRERV